jgi:SAM-dependent methyltransferase
MPATSLRHGELWGARARDWAANEVQQLPTYEEALRRVGDVAGRSVLDIGCGSGVFLRAAADRGACVSGLDASQALLAIARERVPDADLRSGDMESLPWDDDAFDVVGGFNSFFFAGDIVGALREAARVARPGATVVVQVWGRPGRCDLTAMKHAMAAALPAREPDGPPPPPLWQPGVLEHLAAEAGMEPQEAFDVSWDYEYADDDALARGLLSVGLAVEASRIVGEDVLRDAFVSALAAYRTPGGGYRLRNEFHLLLARPLA